MIFFPQSVTMVQEWRHQKQRADRKQYNIRRLIWAAPIENDGAQSG
jgi:hypothetical protein